MTIAILLSACSMIGDMETAHDRDLLDAQLGRAEDGARFLAAIEKFDILNDDDPHRVAFLGREVGYELFFSMQLFAKVVALDPLASEPLMLAARSQHLCRWMIPRQDYPMDRPGYLKWRSDLKKFHASKASGVLESLNYGEGAIARVRDLNLKKNLRDDPECQTLEDALCLVFLEKQFADFSAKTDEDKMIGILRKSWAKMSEKGRVAAMALPMGAPQKWLVERALAG